MVELTRSCPAWGKRSGKLAPAKGDPRRSIHRQIVVPLSIEAEKEVSVVGPLRAQDILTKVPLSQLLP